MAGHLLDSLCDRHWWVRAEIDFRGAAPRHRVIACFAKDGLEFNAHHQEVCQAAGQAELATSVRLFADTYRHPLPSAAVDPTPTFKVATA